MDEGYLSQPESIAFPTTDGKTAYMNHYPPANKDFQLPDGAAPPLLVSSRQTTDHSHNYCYLCELSIQSCVTRPPRSRFMAAPQPRRQRPSAWAFSSGPAEVRKFEVLCVDLSMPKGCQSVVKLF